LFLDLYVPKSVFEEENEEPLPVVVWLYGGAFAFGSKDQLGPLYTGRSMLSQSQYQTIFIAGNYRVGAYGWLAGDYMQKVGQPNAGLYDQALLFEWVQNYVSQVGGNSSRVSAWGESAGAGSILHHLIREGGTKDPTFKTFAVQSPAFEWAWDNSPGGKLDKVYQNFSQLAGCGLTFDIDCLRASTNLSDANQMLFNTVRQTGLFPVGPAVDGKWIETIPTISFSNGTLYPRHHACLLSDSK
jgi:carboxylesterase type B